MFVLGQRFDFLTFDRADTLPTRGAVDESGKPASLQTAANFRATTGMFGAGYLEMLARQMTEELQAIRDTIRLGETQELVAKGIRFGSADADESRPVGHLEGRGPRPPEPALPPARTIRRRWSSARGTRRATSSRCASSPTPRSTTITASSPPSASACDTDPDGDGFTNEMTRADVTAVSVWQATLQVPGRVIPRDPEIERAVLMGERRFERIGCATCHVPRLPLEQERLDLFRAESVQPAGQPAHAARRATLNVDLSSEQLPRAAPAARRVGRRVGRGLHRFQAARHLRAADDARAARHEPVAVVDRRSLDGNCRFLTKRLWGAANEPPFFHHGLFTTLRQSVLAHAGEALASRRAFEALPPTEQDARRSSS